MCVYVQWVPLSLTIDRSLSRKDDHNQLQIHPILLQLPEQWFHVVYSIYVPIEERVIAEGHTSIVADLPQMPDEVPVR